MPGDFGLEREGDVLFEEGDAVFAGVGGGSIFFRLFCLFVA
jgi:hypothetical protein